MAHKFGIHYFDLTEDVATTRAIRTLDASADAVMIPLLAFLHTTTGHLFAEHHPALRTL